MSRSVGVGRLVTLLRERMGEQQRIAQQHPDADVLTAFASGNLSRRERGEIADHLASCGECRQVLALATIAGREPAARASSGVAWSWILRAATVAAAACIIVVAVRERPIENPALVLTKPASKPEQAQPAVPPVQSVAPPAQSPRIEVHKRPSADRKQVVPAISPQEPTPESRIPLEARTLQPIPESDSDATRQALDLKVQSTAITQAFAKSTAETGETAAIPPRVQPVLRAPEVRQYVKPSIGQGLVSGFAFQNATASPAESKAESKYLWELAAPGTVMRSADGGGSWTTFVVDGETELFALSATKSDVWVGGAQGRLFHSSDQGVHWTPVAVKNEGGEMKEAIVSIEALGGLDVTVKTQSHQRWTSIDGGKHWQMLLQ